jgi:hypothetical protein
MSETRHVHVFKVNKDLTMSPIKKRSNKWVQCQRHRMHRYRLEQTCLTGMLEVVKRIRCSEDCLQEVVVRVIEVVGSSCTSC